MVSGLNSRFNILQESPLDHQPPPPLPEPKTGRWVASRYNIQTTTDDGRLIVWNTLQGKSSTFQAAQRDRVRALLTRTGCEASSQGLPGYLYERGFLIPEGTDEYRIFQHRFGAAQYRQDILELILLASEDCNFRCQYCYEEFARGTMRPEVRAAVKKLVEKRLPSLRTLAISWFGGEPLYGWAAIEDLAPFFRQVAADNSLAFFSNITTNGYLLTPDVAGKMLSWGVTRYQITIDGAPEDHNRNRPARNGEATFDTIFANLQALRRRSEDLICDIRINFDRQNRTGLDDFIDLLGREFGGDPRFNLRLRPVGKWGGPNDENLEVCGLGESREVAYQLVERALGQRLGNADHVRHAMPFGSGVCYASRPYNFIVGADGQVMKCTVDLDKEDRNIVGQLDENGELHLDMHKFTGWTEPAYTSDTGCQKCVILPICQGISCPQIRMDTQHSPCIPLRKTAKRDLLLAARFKAVVREKTVKDVPA
jgi:uncharacterized protein